MAKSQTEKSNAGARGGQGTPEVDARRVKAMDMRLAGASYRAIGTALGVNVATAYDDVQRMLREYMAETGEEVRKQEIQRLDRLMMAHWNAAIQGDAKATQMVLSIMDRRARLLGIDAPLKVDITQWVMEQARAEGLDEREAVRFADEFVRQLAAT